MSFKMASMESFSFNGEEIGAAGGAALRKVKTLADSAPKGRLFAAIATLDELSTTTTAALEAGNLPRAQHVAAKLARAGEIKMPNFFKRKARSGA
jgi:hypothetical protein